MSTTTQQTASEAANALVPVAVRTAEAAQAFALTLPPWKREPIYRKAAALLAAAVEHAEGIGCESSGDAAAELSCARAAEYVLAFKIAAHNVSAQRPPRRQREGATL